MTEEYTVGTCGNCGGPVRMPAIWHGVTPPPKRCAWCGAEARDFGPVLPMSPQRGVLRQVTYRPGAYRNTNLGVDGGDSW